MSSKTEINQLLAFVQIICKEEMKAEYLQALETVEERLTEASMFQLSSSFHLTLAGKTASVSTRLSLMTAIYEELSKLIADNIFTKACKKVDSIIILMFSLLISHF